MSLLKIIMSTIIAFVVFVASTPGRAQNIISLDAGVLPSTPNIVSGGFDFVNNDSDPDDQTSVNHGDVVARVIADVFPGAQIVPVKIVGSNFTGSTTITDTGLSYAASQGFPRVVVKTSGPPGGIAQWRSVVNANKVAVVPAGNNSLPNPENDALFAPALGGSMIIVGSVDGSGNISPFSSRAGELANFYITAPGANQFSSVKGTSFAAPRVAAVAAQILSQNPNLSPQQVTEIILTTADDRGDAGVDEVYGYGQLNKDRATAPIGTGGGSSSGGGAIVAAAVIVGAAVAYGISKNRDEDSLENTFITDIYDRGYVFDMTRRISARNESPNLFSLLSDFDQKSDTFIVSQNESGRSYATLTTELNESQLLANRLDPTETMDDLNDNYTKLSFYHESTDSSDYQLSINDSIRTGFGAFSLFQKYNESMPGFEYTKTFTSPYLSFTDQGIASRAGYQLSDRYRFNFGLSSNQESDRYGLESDSAVIEGIFQNEKIGIGVQLGSLREMGSLFGGSSGGILSVDDSKTLSLGASSSYKINEKLSAIGNYTEGYTKVDDWEGSYLQNFSNIRSNAYGVGLVGNGIFKKTDQLGLGYSRPLKVTSGGVDLRVPAGRQDFGEPVYYNEERINLNPTASEQAFEAYYSFQPKEGIELTTYFLHQNNPDHNSDARGENTLLATLKFKF